jgi:hypothetical protein
VQQIAAKCSITCCIYNYLLEVQNSLNDAIDCTIRRNEYPESIPALLEWPRS